MTRPRVLVVDDTASIRLLIRLNLETEGYEVAEAEDGREVLAAVRQQRPDLITMDVMMAHLGGFETAEQLRADPATADIPIVLVTTQSRPSDLRRGEEIGVAAYVIKPFDPEELVDTVRTVLAHPANR